MKDFRLDYFLPERWDEELPGFSVGVRKDGKDLLVHHQGMANIEYKLPINDETPFHVASVSKQFTCYLIYKLQQEGLIDLDKPVGDYLDFFPDCFENVTVRHMIHHVSGLKDIWELFRMSAWSEGDLKSMEQARKIVAGQSSLNFEPESEHNYSNTGYILLAMIVEEVMGKSFDELAQDLIFVPLGMKASFIREHSDSVLSNRTYSYELDKNGVFHKANLNYSIYGTTSLFSTVKDLLKWGNHILDLRTEDAELYKLMSESFILSDKTDSLYAGGLMHKDFLSYKTLIHGGWDAGYRASLLIIPELNLVSCCLSNNSTFKPEGYAKYYAKLAVQSLMDEEDPFMEGLKLLIAKEDILATEEITGYYSNARGSYFHVKQDGEKLSITMPGMLELPLAKHPDGGYWIKDTEMRFFFSKFEDSVKLTSAYPYDLQESYKLKTKSRADYAGYLGTYFSAELLSFFEIVAEEDKLIIKNRRLHTTELLALQDEKNRFILKPGEDCLEGELEFFGDQKIEGFYIHRPRAMGVEFNKQ